MTDLLNSESGVDPRTEQARKAVKVFRSMQPQLTAYARAITKKKRVQVQLAKTGQSRAQTDGETIWFIPPIELGDMRAHVRDLCDKRDENLQQRCPTCRLRENVLSTIYHEIAHICYDSFMPVTEEDRIEITRRAVEISGTKYAEALMKKYNEAPRYLKNSYKGLSSLFNEFLPLINNSLEDARVNREMFEARHGTRAMMEANIRDIFARGVEYRDPQTGEVKRSMWNERPLNLQVIIGLFLKASGYDYRGWLAPKVEVDLADERLTQVLNRLAHVRTASGVYDLSFKVLTELRRLGYCKLPDDPEQEDDQDDTEEEGDSSNPGREDSSSDSTDPDGGADDEGEGEGDSSSAGSEQSDDGADSDSGSSNPGDGEGEGAEGESSDQSGDEGGPAPGDSDDTDPGAESDDTDGRSKEGSGGVDGDSDPSEGVVGPSDGLPEEDEAGSSPGESFDARDGEAGASSPEDDAGVSGQDNDETPADPGSSDSGSQGDVRDHRREASDGSEDLDGQQQDIDGGDRTEPGHSADDDHLQPTTEDESEVDNGVESGSEGGAVPDAGQELGADDTQPSAGSGAEPDTNDEAQSIGSSEASGDGYDQGDDDSAPSDEFDGSHSDDAAAGEDDEPIDTGADEGLGGIQVEELPPFGSPEEISEDLDKVIGHAELTPSEQVAKGKAEQEVLKAIVQGMYFETPSQGLRGVDEFNFDATDPADKGDAWYNEGLSPIQLRQYGIKADVDPAEQVLGPALLRMRVAFSDNKRGRDINNLKSGKIHARVLGKRAFHDDPRLFKRRIHPGKKDYFVVIGMDISGSTRGMNLILEKRAIMAQAVLLQRMGIKFAIYAHTANSSRYSEREVDLQIYPIKKPNEPWSDKVQERLRSIGSSGINADGHALEYLRKVADTEQATDKIILYYSDGKMPAFSYHEELEVLQREIQRCNRIGYTLLGVGIRTDSPRRHGLDTVQVDQDADIVQVVRHIERRLLDV